MNIRTNLLEEYIIFVDNKEKKYKIMDMYNHIVYTYNYSNILVF